MWNRVATLYVLHLDLFLEMDMNAYPLHLILHIVDKDYAFYMDKYISTRKSNYLNILLSWVPTGLYLIQHSTSHYPLQAKQVGR